jgi:hypothetical protein
MSVRQWLSCVPVLVAGACDGLFGLDRLYECRPDDDDCDGLPDEVDPCPGNPGTAADEDGDGVGDECDPNIGLPVDALLEFESFSTPDPRWRERGAATWQFTGSALELVDGAVERAAPPNRQPSVELFVTPSFRNEGAIVGAFVASKSATGVPLECRVEHHASGDDLVMLVGDPAEGTTEVGRARNLRGLPSEGLRIFGSQLTDYIVRCHARYGSSDALHVEWAYFTGPADFDTIGFRVSRASAAFHALTIYTRRP